MPPVRAIFAVPIATLCALSCLSCASDKPHFAVRYADGSPPISGPLSVFGVFENGRLSPDAWRELGPEISSAFSTSPCESAWTEQFVNANPTLTAAIDAYTKDESITEKLLVRLAPMAQGKSILSLVVLSHRASESAQDHSTSSRPSMATQARTGGIGRGGMRGTGWAQPSLSDSKGAESNAVTYEISALLYSIEQKRTVALVSMTYEGANLVPALQQYAAKLRATVPNVTCTGWSLDAPVDVEGIRGLVKPVTEEPDVE